MVGGNDIVGDRMKIFFMGIIMCMMVCAGGGCGSGREKTKGRHEAAALPSVTIGNAAIGTDTLHFYIDADEDCAILGFSVRIGSGVRYFPLYGSTYRGIAPVTLDVFASKSLEEVWVRSSWAGYETLAWYRTGSDTCLTRFGEIASSDKPFVSFLSGSVPQFPPMDTAGTVHVATLSWSSSIPYK